MAATRSHDSSLPSVWFLAELKKKNMKKNTETTEWTSMKCWKCSTWFSHLFALCHTVGRFRLHPGSCPSSCSRDRSLARLCSELLRGRGWMHKRKREEEEEELEDRGRGRESREQLSTFMIHFAFRIRSKGNMHELCACVCDFSM